MVQKYPFLIQEKLDFYGWLCKQKNVIKGYHVKYKRVGLDIVKILPQFVRYEPSSCN